METLKIWVSLYWFINNGHEGLSQNTILIQYLNLLAWQHFFVFLPNTFDIQKATGSVGQMVSCFNSCQLKKSCGYTFKDPFKINGMKLQYLVFISLFLLNVRTLYFWSLVSLLVRKHPFTEYYFFSCHVAPVDQYSTDLSWPRLLSPCFCLEPVTTAAASPPLPTEQKWGPTGDVSCSQSLCCSDWLAMVSQSAHMPIMIYTTVALHK